MLWAAGATNIGGERKVVKINHGRQTRVTDLIGNLNAVLFSSIDLDIVRGEPEERRRLPVGRYPLDRWSDPAWAYDDEKHGERRRALAAAIHRRMREEGS